MHTRFYTLYDRLTIETGRNELVVLCGLSALALLLSVFLFSAGRWKYLARLLYGAAVVLLMMGLFLIKEQSLTIRTKSDVAGWPDNITYMSRYSYPMRYGAFVGLIAVPIIAIWAFYLGRAISYRRLRDKVPNIIKDAMKSFFQKDYAAAIAGFTKAITIDRRRAEAYNGRGNAYREKGELDRALADFNRAIELDRQLAAAYLNRGLVHAAKDHHDLAVIDFNHALDLRPHEARSYLYRGTSLAKLNDRTGAIADFQMIIQLTNHSDYVDPAREHLRQLGVG